MPYPYTHGSMALKPWDQAARHELVDGVLTLLEDTDGEPFFLFRQLGTSKFVGFYTKNITSVERKASALNIVVDVEFVGIIGEGDPRALDLEPGPLQACIVAPRGRLKKLFAAAGFQI